MHILVSEGMICMKKIYCVYDNKNNEQLLLVADTVKEVAKYVEMRPRYVLQSILRGNTVNKHKYIVKRVFLID